MAFNSAEAFWLLLLLPVLISAGLGLRLLRKRDRERFAEAELYNVLARSNSGMT